MSSGRVGKAIVPQAFLRAVLGGTGNWRNFSHRQFRAAQGSLDY